MPVLCIVACTLLFTGCATRRNTAGTRAYHELTTRYNIYFNAEETYQEILKERAENLREDYAELLPLYPPLPDTGTSASGGPFAPVIDKTEKAIREHSITAKPRRDPAKAHSQEYREWLRQEEFNPFLKNVWLLHGKACLQNGDHDEALSVFSGMLRLFSHDPDLSDETEIWMLRTYTEMGRMYEAERTAYTLRNKRLSDPLETLFTEHYTYFLIRRKDFAGAIPYLRKIIAHEPDYSRKKRLQFLLGQLYTITGEKNNARQVFEEVKGLRTPFELTLNATLWQSALTVGEQQQAIMRRLNKMEQKVNSVDSAAFSDQRYRIYLKAGNDSLAMAFQPPTPDNAPDNDPGNDLGNDPGNDPAQGATIGATAAADSTAGNIGKTGNTGTTGNTKTTGNTGIIGHPGNIKTNGKTETNGKTGNVPQRFSQGRTLAENAALHRQWRSRNGLWQPQSGANQMQSAGTITPTPFNPDKNGPHFLLLAFTPGSADKNQLLFTTADFNFSHFKLRRFKLSFNYLPASEALQIEPFQSFEEVSRYTEMMHADSLFRAALPVEIIPIIISEKNLALIRSGKQMDEYNTFYAENIAPAKTAFQSSKRDETIEIEEKNKQGTEKIVSLEMLDISPDSIPEQKEISVPPQPISRTGGETTGGRAFQQQPEQQAGEKTTGQKTAEEKATGERPVRPERVVQPERETPEALKQRLEENAAKALQQQQETAPRKSREQILKERERQREEKIRQRERELKERQRKREAELKQRERERAQKIREQQ